MEERLSPLRIIFMGSPDFAVPTMQALMDAGHDIVCVYAQPPRPAGRGQKERLCPVHAAALDAAIEVRTPKDLKSSEDQAAFAAIDADVAVVVAYGLLLPIEILNAPRLGCINVHASLLPRWRGAAPIQRAILAGDTQAGVCIMAMEAGLDTGPVYLRRAVSLDPDMTGGLLHDTLCDIGAQACVEALGGIADGTLQPVAQSQDGVTYARKLNPSEAQLDWSLDCAELERAVRAFDPWPGTWFEHNGERVKVLAAQADMTGHVRAEPGTVLDGRPAIACGSGALVLQRLQRAGRKAQNADEFMRGYELAVGTILSE